MSNRIVLFSVFVLALLVLWRDQPVQPLSAQAAGMRQISTTGDAEIKVAPDQVSLILGVETWDKDIRTAKKQNDERVNQVMALTRNYGIDAKNVQTDQINVEPRYRNGTYLDTDFLGYFVRKSIVVTLKDVNKFEDFYTAALAAGVNHVQGIEFRTTDLRKYRDQARELAIKAALEKAVAMAGTLGQKVGQAQSIHEDYTGWSSWYGSRWGNSMSQNVVQNAGGAPSGDLGSFAPGQISVTARVSITFAIE